MSDTATHRIFSYNLNGIRSALSKGLGQWIEMHQPDVLCIQETKAQPDQIEKGFFESLGYYAFWHSAIKKGYSGVGIISKEKPRNVVYGCGNPEIDIEGRIIRADFEMYSVISVYVPSASNIDRLGYKFWFKKFFIDYLTDLQKDIPNLIICGDFNIAHQEIDIHDPKRLAKVSGFLPEERELMTQLLEQNALKDSFRLHPQSPEIYSWWSYRQGARGKNKGWRIDYALISDSLAPYCTASAIHTDVVHSDHCPVSVSLSFEIN